MPTPSLDQAMLRDCLEQGRALLAETRALIRDAFEKDFAYRRKTDQSWVTDIDLAVERLMRSRLTEWFPQHGIVGEEFAEQNHWAELTWVIDPIDGTSSLRHRIPLFGTLLALLHQDRPVLGLIDLPMLGRLYSGGTGLGAWCNGRSLNLAGSSNSSPEAAASPPAAPSEIISVGDRAQFVAAGVPQLFDQLMQRGGTVRTYSDCFGHGLVLEGAIGAQLDFDLRLWDVAATRALISEAGGKFVCVRQRGEGPEIRYDVTFGKPAVVDWIIGTLPLSEPRAHK